MLELQRGTDTEGPVKETEKLLPGRRKNVERAWYPRGQERRESYVVVGGMGDA